MLSTGEHRVQDRHSLWAHEAPGLAEQTAIVKVFTQANT